jgi:hypothetical protein
MTRGGIPYQWYVYQSATPLSRPKETRRVGSAKSLGTPQFVGLLTAFSSVVPLLLRSRRKLHERSGCMIPRIAQERKITYQFVYKLTRTNK